LPTDRALKIATGLVAVVLITAALAQARAVFEPLVLALFIIAIVWPLQHWLQRRIPPLLALAVTIMLVGAFAWIAGLPFPVEWGVIAFVLNYIPFVGPFLATVFPTLLAMTQFHSWQAVLGVFLCLNVIQFVIGSYVEPRVSGNVLTISPLLVVFATFLWTYPWGLFGTFIGVPITLAILTFCDQHPSSRWLADLFGQPLRQRSASRR